MLNQPNLMDKLQIIERITNFLECGKSNPKYKRSSKDFTRDRKLNFTRVVLFIMNLPKKSLSVELDDFYRLLGKDKEICTKSAFSQARKKLRHVFFIDWTEALLRFYYESCKAKRWKGFLLLSVDGSKGSLFEDEDLSEEFGRENGKVGARLFNVYDVNNRLNVYSELAGIRVSENKLAKKFVTELKHRDYLDKSLMIYDRNYAGFEFIYLHHIESVNYLARCKTNNYSKLVNDFLAINVNDLIMDFYPPDTALRSMKKQGHKIDKNYRIKVRLIRVILDTGEVEVLITSLLDQEEYPHEIFKDLYFLRWPVETEYDCWKNKLQIEIFSGHTVEAIKQDFYANVFTINLLSLLIEDCEIKVADLSKGKKYAYAINRNVAIGLVKQGGGLIYLLTRKDKAEIWVNLQNNLIKYLEPVRKNRSFKRNKRIIKIRGKYRHHKNYKRAM